MIWSILHLVFYGLFALSALLYAIGGLLLEKQRLKDSRNRTAALSRISTELWRINNRLNSYYKAKTAEQTEPEKGEDKNV